MLLGNTYNLSYDEYFILYDCIYAAVTDSAPRVAVLREEGSNGDREMSAAFYTAGFKVHDVTMTDLISGDVTLQSFQGIAFVGGFSYADVLGSAKGKHFLYVI